jgi:hypothetical protein
MKAVFYARYGLPDVLRLADVDRRYSLSELPEALRYLGEGHAKGKVVVTVE